MEFEEKRQPLISVIMGVYNCEKTVSDAIESILNQSLQDFEFIICDDGSTDQTAQIVCMFAKQSDKIIFLKNDGNRGLNYTLNHCLRYAKGKYVARMDGDDLSMPERFEKQIAFLESHVEFSIVSCAQKVFDEDGVWATHILKEYPQKNDLVHGAPFCHPASMVLRDAFYEVGGYSEGAWLMRVEDFHLWVKMYEKNYRGANLSDTLYLYRDDRAAYARRKLRYRFNESYVIGLAVKKLHLSIWNYIYVLRPIIVGMLPSGLYDVLHKWKMKKA